MEPSLASMNIDLASRCLAELGSPVRLAIYRLLVRAGGDGLTFGELQQRLEIPQSTLSHHVARLAWAGLIDHAREGRTHRCRARYDMMDGLIAFLAEECCADARCADAGKRSA